VSPSIEIDGKCPNVQLEPIPLPSCPPPPKPPEFLCAAIEEIEVTEPIGVPGGCMLVWRAVLNRDLPGTFEWHFEDGSTTTTTVPTISRNYSGSGRKWVEVWFHPADDRCPINRFGREVDLDCPATSTGGEKTGCFIARTAMIIFLAASLAVLAYTTCPSPPAPSLASLLAISGGFMLLFLVTLVLWLALCKSRPCAYGLLFTGLGLVGAGMVLLNLSRCCPTMAFVGAVAILAGIGILIAWKAECDKTWCELLVELGFFAAGNLAVLLVLVVAVGCVPDFSEEATAAALLVAFDTLLALTSAGAIACLRGPSVEPVHELPSGIRMPLKR
jgi:hypothetical protein